MRLGKSSAKRLEAAHAPGVLLIVQVFDNQWLKEVNYNLHGILVISLFRQFPLIATAPVSPSLSARTFLLVRICGALHHEQTVPVK